LPAKNDNAVILVHRGASFAGKPRSYRDDDYKVRG
jgi:hypothetical protein